MSPRSATATPSRPGRPRRPGQKGGVNEKGGPLVETSFRAQAGEALRAEGHRLTKQRDVLLDVIERSDRHLDADSIHRLARARDARVSLSTVYRTLSLLKRRNLIDELHLSEEHHHYEPKSTSQHFHLVCSDCGTVEEFIGGAVEALRDSLRRNRGFEVTSLQLDVVGRCGRCPSGATRPQR